MFPGKPLFSLGKTLESYVKHSMIAMKISDLEKFEKKKPKSKLSNWESKKKVNLKMDLEKVKT